MRRMKHSAMGALIYTVEVAYINLQGFAMWAYRQIGIDIEDILLRPLEIVHARLCHYDYE